MLKRIFIILSVIFITFSCNNNEAGEIRESIQLSDDWNFVVDSLDKGDTKNGMQTIRIHCLFHCLFLTLGM